MKNYLVFKKIASVQINSGEIIKKEKYELTEVLKGRTCLIDFLLVSSIAYSPTSATGVISFPPGLTDRGR
jgi:hypothetical protein